MAWTTLIVQLVAALATVGAVILALFGRRWRAWLDPPKLYLEFVNPDGVKTPVYL
jgi:hypothetical protein